MKYFRLKKPDGSSNFVRTEAVLWIEAENRGATSILHLLGGSSIRSGMPSEDLARALSNEPKPTPAPQPVPSPKPGAIAPETPPISFEQVKPVKVAKAKTE